MGIHQELIFSKTKISKKIIPLYLFDPEELYLLSYKYYQN